MTTSCSKVVGAWKGWIDSMGPAVQSGDTFKFGGKSVSKSGTVEASNLLIGSNKFMAGRESLDWHPLVEDFVVIGRRLEKLGFIYNRGSVLVLDE